jgi:hypothetical protein
MASNLQNEPQLFSVSQLDLFNNAAGGGGGNLVGGNNELQLPVGGSNMSTCSSTAATQLTSNTNTQLRVARNSILISTQDIHKLVIFRISFFFFCTNFDTVNLHENSRFRYFIQAS